MVSGGGEARKIVGIGVLLISTMFRLRRRLERAGGDGLGSMAITVGYKRLIWTGDRRVASSEWRERERERERDRENERTRGWEKEERGVEEMRNCNKWKEELSTCHFALTTTSTDNPTTDTSGTTVHAQRPYDLCRILTTSYTQILLYASHH